MILSIPPAHIYIAKGLAVIIDPGLHRDWCLENLKKHAASCKVILLTAVDLAHAGRAAEIQSATGASVFASKKLWVKFPQMIQEAKHKNICGVKIPQVTPAEGFSGLPELKIEVLLGDPVGYKIGDQVFGR